MMASKFIAAAIQFGAGEDRDANLAIAERLVAEAAGRGAALVVLPEMFNRWGRFETMAAHAETIPGPTSAAASEWARRLNIILVAGSIAEKSPDADQMRRGGKAFNTSLIFGPDGKLLARYRKRHLFDVELSGQPAIRESDWILPGDDVSVVSTSVGNVGQAICYDLRFPELFCQLADRNVEIIVVPSAFLQTTGAAHWDVLLRARAIENQAFVIASNQTGSAGTAPPTYGHSQLIDPWGRVLASCEDENASIVMAEIDMESLLAVRVQLPSLRHRLTNQKQKGH